MAGDAAERNDGGKAERFKALALPHLDEVYTLARYLMRGANIINLFCAPAPMAARRAATMQSLHGYNVRSWSENGLNLWAVSDINPEELTEFGEKFEAALGQ